jgi:hypothetical protein
MSGTVYFHGLGASEVEGPGDSWQPSKNWIRATKEIVKDLDRLIVISCGDRF